MAPTDATAPPPPGRKEFADRGVDVSDVQLLPWGSFVFFKDPDGNGWALQAMTHRGEPG